VLVGGTTRIPKVQSMLSEYFGGKELCKSINPDEAVAYGAAVQAAILAGHGDSKTDEILLMDVCPLTLAVEERGMYAEAIIPRNTTIPCKKTKTFSNGADNQTTFLIKIYEGERKLTKDCNLLGSFELTDVPPMRRGTAQIEISMDVDANGILNVSAVEKSSGKSKNITITNDKNRLSKEDIERMTQEAEKYKEEDEKNVERMRARNTLEDLLYSSKSSLEEEKLKDKFTEEDKKTILDKAKEVEEWLQDNSTASLDDIKAKTKEFETVFNPIMQRVYSQASPNGEMPTGMGGMPAGMGGMPTGMGGMPTGMGGMPTGMGGDFSPEKLQEMMNNLTPEQRKQMDEMMKNMGKSGGGGVGGGSKTEELD
jgi:L1 cell adhesion molecule like protein